MSINETINIYDRGKNRAVVFGFPLKETFNVLDVTSLRLTYQGANIPAFFKVNSRWKGLPSDTSKPVKWLAVAFQSAASPRTLVLTDQSGAVPATTNPIAVANNTNDYTVSNGLMDITINKTTGSFDLCTSFKTGGTERIGTNKMRVSLPVPSGSKTVGASPYDYAMAPNTSTVQVADASQFTVGQTVKFVWEGTINYYLKTGGYAVHPVIVINPPFDIDQITSGFTPKINLLLHYGLGNQQQVQLYYTTGGTGEMLLTTIPTNDPLAGEKVRIKEVEDAGTLTISSIDPGANTITFSAPVAGPIPSGVSVQPVGGGSQNGGFKITNCVIEKQYGDLSCIIRQDGILSALSGGAQLSPTLKFEQRYYVYADTAAIRVRTSWQNSQDTFGGSPAPNINVDSMNLEFDLNQTSTSQTDSCLDMTSSVLRYKAGTGDSVLTHSAVANFKFAIPELAEQFPRKHTAATAYKWEMHPTGQVNTLHGASRKTHDCFIGINSDALMDMVYVLGVTFDPIYMTSSKAIRPNLVEKRNWNSVFSAETQRLKDAATRYERLVSSSYDITSCELISGTRIAQTIYEYRTEYPEKRTGANYYPFGWTRFGQTTEDVGFTNNRYDIPYILFREGCRESDATKTEKAWKLAFQQIRNRIEIGQHWSQTSFNGTFLNLFGLALYERAIAPDPYSSYGGKDPIPTHSWNEGSCLYWALTDDPIAYRAAVAGANSAVQYDYQGTYGARYQGNGLYVLKDPATGLGIAEPRYVGWPILNLVTGYRYFGDPNYLQKAIDYSTSFIVTQAGEPVDDGYTAYMDADGVTIQPLFQYGGYVMHGIIEAWRETSGAAQTTLGTFIAKVAQFLYKGDQRLAVPGPDSPTIANGWLHPSDPTKYNPATWFPFTFKRSFGDALSSNITNIQTTIPVTDSTSFLLHSNGDYDNYYPTRAIGVIAGNINDPSTWEYFQYTGKSGNTLTGVTRGWGSTPAAAWNAGTVVLPLAFDGALNDVVVATLIAGARASGQQALQDWAQKIWEDNCLYRDVYPQGQPIFATVGQYSKINFWPNNIGDSAPKTFGQSATALSEFLGDRVVPQPIPAIGSIAPNYIATGSGDTVVTITGSNFDPNATVRVNATSVASTYLSPTQLTAILPQSLLASTGTRQLSITNPLSGNSSPLTAVYVANAPNVTSIFPTNAGQNSGSFLLNINGSYFDSNCVVRWGGANRTTTLVGSTLQAQIPQGDLTAAGSVNITVLNTVTGIVSNATAFTVTAQTNPTPSLSSLSPSSATAGDPQLTLTINGSGFVSGVVAKWGSTSLSTTYVSGTQITAIVPAGLIATQGSASVTAVNPGPGGGASNGLNFSIGAIVQPPPAPSITSLSPTSVTAGSAQFIVTINGSNFDNSCIARWNGVDLATTYVSASQLTAVIPSANLTAPTTASITVRSVDNNQTSSPATLAVTTAPVPSIISLSPSSTVAGSSQLSLTVNGANFASDAVVLWNGVALSTSFISNSQVTAIVPGVNVAAATTAAVAVRNVGTQQVSSSSQFTVSALPAPQISSISPNTVNVGDPQLTLTVNGTNFQSGAAVRVNGQQRATAFVSSTQLTATITSGDLATIANQLITVLNPDSQASEPATLQVQQPPPGLPTVTSISPASATPGLYQQLVTVLGTNFTLGSIIRVGGVNRPTEYLTSSLLQVTLLQADLAFAGTLQLTVYTPPPGGGTSDPVNLPVTAVSSTAPRIRPDMVPDRRTLYIRQGKTFRLSTRILIGRDLVNLTNCDARFQIRKRFADDENPPAPLMDLTVANGGIVIDPANGYITIQLTPAQTEGYRTPRAMFELEVTDNTSQIVVGILEGDIRLQREIVR